MTTPIHIVDAFSDRSFRGNTCAVCLFETWPDDNLLLKIAKQNMLAETAFIVTGKGEAPELRWFTVSQEVSFCGYGTISAGYVYLTHVAPTKENVVFTTRTYGLLPVRKHNDLFEIEAPVKQPTTMFFDNDISLALGGTRPQAMIQSERGDLIIRYDSEDAVRSVQPDFIRLMAATSYYGFVLTAPGKKADFAYRYFSPRMTNVWEDPVNGASLSVLAPYWAKELNKAFIRGEAVSSRGGDVVCAYEGGSIVRIAGNVTPYSNGTLVL